MKVLIIAVGLLSLLELCRAQNGTQECDLQCTDEYYPVCAMEVRVNKKIFSNDCVMWRENECNGSKFVYCENWMT